MNTKALNSNHAHRLHALIIGINIYPFANLPPLRSAVSDADAFERYLIEHLRVPTCNIRNLRAADATRSNILNALQSLQVDSNIEFGDAIVIYYSGHGGRARASPGWGTERDEIQMILPSDLGPSVYGIPDRTIGALLESLAKARGDNITVIFDCCFSGSGTRFDNPEEPKEQTRGVSITIPFPSGLDEEILASSNRGTAIPATFLHAGLRSHVLLAACNSHERAREANGSGYFTKALLDTLKTIRVETITYTELMNHLPKLPTQNPQCEGYNRNRILFNAKVASNSFLHKINQTVDGRYEIGVGEAYGITQHTHFIVHPSHQHAHNGPALEVKPLRISASKTLLDLPSDMAAAISQGAVVLLEVRVGVEEAFPIYISDGSMARLGGIIDGVRYEMKKRGMREVSVVSNVDLARLGLDLELDNTTRNLVVVLRVLDPSISRWGLNKIHYTPSLDDLFPVLCAAAHFDWHLHRESRGIGTSQVDIEFTKLQEISETFGRQTLGGRASDMMLERLVPHGPNMIETGFGQGGNVVLIDVSEEALYGMKLTNKTNVPLYVSIFYFDSSDFSIKSLHEPSISTAQSTAEAPLKPQQSLTIGYGLSAFPSFDYFLREGQEVDVGTLKFYFSTEAVDLMYLRQESPFGMRAGGVIGSRARRAVWGTVEVRVVQRRGLGRTAGNVSHPNNNSEMRATACLCI